MKGLGICDENFSTVISENDGTGNYYVSDAYKLNLQLYPQGDGYFSAISFKQGTLYLKNDNSNNTYYLNQLNMDNYYAEIGRQFTRTKVRFKIKGYAGFLQKKGSEYNYTQSETLLSIAQKYNQREFSGGIVCFASNTNPSSERQYFIKAGIGYYKYQSEYQLPGPEPKAYQKFEFVSPELTAGMNKQYSKSELTVKIAMRYDYCLSKGLNEASLAISEAGKSLVIPDFEYLSAKKIYLSPEIRYGIDLKNNYGIYLMAKQFNEFYIDARSQMGVNIALGLTL